MEMFKILSEVDGVMIEGNLGDKKNTIFRITKDSKTLELTRDFLYQLIMLYGLPKQQEDLIVVSNKKMRTVRRQLRIKAKSDIKEGEDIVVEVDFPVAEDVADNIDSFKIN